MKIIMRILIVCTALLAVNAYANGDAYASHTHYARHTHYASRISYAEKPLQLETVLYPGSLRANIYRISRKFGWQRIVWDAQYDYSWVSYTKIYKPRLRQVLQAVLADYPLQAVFYQGNHVLVIRPRTIR